MKRAFCFLSLCFSVLFLCGCGDDEVDAFRYAPHYCTPRSFPTEVTVRGVERIDSSSIRVYCEENRAYLAPYGVGEGKFSIDLPSPNEYRKSVKVSENEEYDIYQAVFPCRVEVDGECVDLYSGFSIGYNKGEDFVGDSRWWLIFFAVGEDTVRVDSYSKVFEVTLEKRPGGFGLISEGE